MSMQKADDYLRQQGSRPDSMPSSRAASEEPELLSNTSTPEKSISSRFSMDTASPRDDRKKRRFSITSFHRPSRSRSRPNSIVLPSNTSLFSTTPRGTPPREVSRILGDEQSRPHSYHAPDSWNFVPGPQATTTTPTHHQQEQATPPRQMAQQSRLGILPSPAKSAFSAHERTEEDVPPVPKIPEAIRLSNDLSHEVLQSVIRYATPPLGGERGTSMALVGSPDMKDGVSNAVMAQADEDTQGVASSFREITGGTQEEASKHIEGEEHQHPNLQHGAQPGLAVSTDDYDSIQLQQPLGSPNEQKGQRNWETDIIGAGDVSPMSSEDEGDEPTPREDKSHIVPEASNDKSGSTTAAVAPAIVVQEDLKPSSTRGRDDQDQLDTPSKGNLRNTQGDEAERPQPEASSAQDMLRPAPRTSADPPVDQPPRRVSAAPLQVVHAVEEYAASDTSFTSSWDRDSLADHSLSTSSHLGDMKDESDLVTPVAQVPSIVQHGQADTRPEPSSNPSAKPVMQNGYFAANGNATNTMHRPQQPSADLSVPERSKSMLSMISSMVSEGGTPISPASSNAGRSTPSTIRRMQHETSIRHGPGPAQIPEESVLHDDRTPSARDDDFELYADHDGVVKDVRDESGRPLRLPPAQDGNSVGGRGIAESTSSERPTVQETTPDDRPRYSTERPMSFISGPPDQDGKPQDQINQFSHRNTTDAPHQPGQGYHVANAPNGTVYSATTMDHASSHSTLTNSNQNGPSSGSRAEPSMQSGIGQSETTPTNAQVSGRQLPPGSGASNTSTPPPNQPYGPQNNAHMPPNSQMQRVPGQPPNVHGGVQQGGPQNYPPQGQQLRPDVDPRFPQQAGAPGPGPRNEYEYQQHMMQMQARLPRQQDAQAGGLGSGPMPASQMQGRQAPQQQEKSSGKPRFSSMFKGLGGKLQGNSQQTAQPPQPSQPTQQPRPQPQFQAQQPQVQPQQPQLSNVAGQPPMHMGHPGQQNPRPVQPGVPAPSREELVSRSGERPGSALPPQRRLSNGAESHFSQVSQGSSTRVQPTESRSDLRQPVSPAPYQGIPPQQMPGRVPPQFNQQGPNVPETGKKKRFSTLGNIFGKLANENKKVSKAQRHTTAPPGQMPPSQWPPQQPMYRPQQPGTTHVPGQYPQQTMAGMPPLGPQFASPQTMSPVTPQTGRDVPPNLLQQQYPPGQPRFPSQQQVPGVPQEQGSAYLRTRQLAEEHQARKVSGQPVYQLPQQGTQPANPVQSPHPPHPRQSSQDYNGPPPGGYYNPDQKPPMPGQSAYQTSQGPRHSVGQQGQQYPQQQQPVPGRQGGPQGAQIPDRQQPQQQPPHMNDLGRVQQTEQLLTQKPLPRPEPDQTPHDPSRVAQHQPMQQQQGPQQYGPGTHPDRPQQPHQQSAPAVPQGPVPNTSQQPSRVEPDHAAGRRDHAPSQADLLRLQQQEMYRAQQMQQQRQAHPQNNNQHIQNQRSVSGPVPNQAFHPQQNPMPQRHVSQPMAEPQYETPQIPAAYSHVSGAFVSPRDREQQPLFSPPQFQQQRMQPIQEQQMRMPTQEQQVRLAQAQEQQMRMQSPQDQPPRQPPLDQVRLQSSQGQQPGMPSGHEQQLRMQSPQDQPLRAQPPLDQVRMQSPQDQQLRSQPPLDQVRVPSSHGQQPGMPPPQEQQIRTQSLQDQPLRGQPPLDQMRMQPPQDYLARLPPHQEQQVRGQSPQDHMRMQPVPPHQDARIPPVDYQRQYSEPRMQSISPQVSAQSQMPPNPRTHSDASVVSVVSPVSNASPDISNASPPPQQPVQNLRMSSISEVHQGTTERPWHLNFPEGATEQEIVRARQRQYMEEQFTAQQQMHAERAAKSPSPRVATHSESASAHQSNGQEPRVQSSGGFKELLPRTSPQPYSQSVNAQSPQRLSAGTERAVSSHGPQPAQPAPIHPGQVAHPAAYPLPISPNPGTASSPANPLAAALAPPPPPPASHNLGHTPVSHSNSPSPAGQELEKGDREQYEPSPPQDERYPPPQSQSPPYEQQVPDEPPPSYDGPGVPNDGMDKSRPERTRPPNIVTDPYDQAVEPRQRQPSIGLMQHPQPASMAASPQRSTADMGSDSLRRQLLQQEEVARMERIQRAHIQRAESERERQEREAARARARELERSVSGGGRVGSIRSVAGSRNGGTPGWERRGSTSRQVFELPAVEDDEPSMRATSYPGQEWVPPVWTDD